MSSIVADTNVYVSALVFGGKPAVALRLAGAAGFQIATSRTIQAELLATLTGRFGWPAARVDRACHYLWETALWVSPGAGVRASRDREDDHVLDCAIAPGALTILTGDRDLLVLNPFQGIEIITPAAFADRFGHAVD